MPRLLILLLLALAWLPATVSRSAASTTQFGQTGMLNLPTASTLSAGNICVGLWSNCMIGNDRDGVLIPATITMGMATFMEAYGSYPNLLFNDDEVISGRGYADFGFKFRVYGKRSDPLRFGLDLQTRYSIADDPDLDGLVDYVTTAIASYNKEALGLHANLGYAINDSPGSQDYDNQFLLGAGVEYLSGGRLRTIAELSLETEKVSGEDGRVEATVGVQYFITPHLTMNLGAAVGLTDASPNLRLLLGVSTCQGVGTYNRPVPRLSVTGDEEAVPKKPPKPVKVRLLTPLIPQAGMAASSIMQLEVPMLGETQSVTVDPGDRMPPLDFSRLDAQAVSPVALPAAGNGNGNAFPEEVFQATVFRKFSLPDLTFDLDQYSLSAKGKEDLALVAEELRKAKRDYVLSVEGHTDSIGSETYNRNLSYQRAVSVATFLVLRNGLDPARMFVKGLGESTPIADNDTEEGRSKNRRVELLVLLPEAAPGAGKDSKEPAR